MITEKLDTKQLIKSFNQTMDELKKIIISFSAETFNKTPFEGSWTAAQVTDHVSKSLSGVVIALYGRTKLPEREPDQYAEQIKAIFLDFEVKFKSPDFILPDDNPVAKNLLLERVRKNTDKINEVANSLDLFPVCMAVSLPGLGEITRLEWINFAIFHTQRHIRQLKNIKQSFLNN